MHSTNVFLNIKWQRMQSVVVKFVCAEFLVSLFINCFFCYFRTYTYGWSISVRWWKERICIVSGNALINESTLLNVQWIPTNHFNFFFCILVDFKVFGLKRSNSNTTRISLNIRCYKRNFMKRKWNIRFHLIDNNYQLTKSRHWIV